MGLQATVSGIATQFGLAMMFGPMPSRMRCPLTSGTTRGMSAFCRKAEVLSMTMAPAAAARGAYSREMPLPVENKAIWVSAKSKSSSTSTVRDLPPTVKRRPAERLLASRRMSPAGNGRSSMIRRIAPPTAPVAPAMAMFSFSMYSLFARLFA